MAETIFAMEDPKTIALKWLEGEQDRVPFLLEAFYPNEKQQGLEVNWYKGKAPATRILDQSAFDVPTLPLKRGTLEKQETEMVFFKNKLDINEKLRQELLMVYQTGNQTYIDAMENRVFNDYAALLENARITREYLRAMLMTTGALNFSSNGQVASYDFGVPDGNKVSANWSNAETSDPINDIQGWQDEMEEKYGFRPTNLLMNRKTFSKMKASKAIRNSVLAITGVLGGSVSIGDAKIKQYILDETGCTLYIYDKGYTDKETGNFTKFIPDDTFALFIDGTLGRTVFGTTPEEADLMAGTDAVVEIVDTGVAITTFKQPDSVHKSMKVSMVTLPTLEVPEGLIIGTVE